jgi:hypothetical protein
MRCADFLEIWEPQTSGTSTGIALPFALGKIGI